MGISIHFLVIFSNFGSLLLLTNAVEHSTTQVVVEDSEKTQGEILHILRDAYNEASHRLLAEAVVNEPNFKEFLRGKTTAEQFINDKTYYDQFKVQLYRYYIVHLFFVKYPKLKTSVDSFTKDFLSHHPKDIAPKYCYATDFDEFLRKDAKKNEDDLKQTEALIQDPGDLRISIEQLLTAKVNLAYQMSVWQKADKDYYEKLFKYIDENKFADSLQKFTDWRERALSELETIEELVIELYASFASIDAFGDPDEGTA
ncbi:hypothetical protein LSTR_LSTR003528 [Laodelphax striatellus]|uniref:Uncharacterized protein n=1 Tax=Laodelphax striatellus TaxID=195883 RepID=A0A482X8F3_LAOST|nr:hypothetical protein LSTR_LSTR003528 [Laodelphax striatellus]